MNSLAAVEVQQQQQVLGGTALLALASRPLRCSFCPGIMYILPYTTYVPLVSSQ